MPLAGCIMDTTVFDHNPKRKACVAVARPIWNTWV